MTIKKNLENEVDDSWRRKGHVHEGKELAPDVCPACRGLGFIDDDEPEETICLECGGTGEVF